MRASNYVTYYLHKTHTHTRLCLLGPRDKALLRRGKWPGIDFFATDENWRFAEAEESHDVSLSADPRYKLTGEAAGRQIWYQDKSVTRDGTDEKTFHFNAAQNPNSSDQIFRSQMLAKWSRSGKRMPDTEISPESAKGAAVKGLEFYQMLQCDDGHWAGDYGGEKLPCNVCLI